MDFLYTLPIPQSEALARGLSIAVAGLLIVFVALLLISLFIATLPRILNRLAHIWPEVDEPSASDGQGDFSDTDDHHVWAAIGFVLHTELQRQMAAEQAMAKAKS